MSLDSSDPQIQDLRVAWYYIQHDRIGMAGVVLSCIKNSTKANLQNNDNPFNANKIVNDIATELFDDLKSVTNEGLSREKRGEKLRKKCVEIFQDYCMEDRIVPLELDGSEDRESQTERLSKIQWLEKELQESEKDYMELYEKYEG